MESSVGCLSSVSDKMDNNLIESEKLNAFSLLGEHETQLSENEANLHTHLANCKNNLGHKEFVPIESFKLEHLPEGFRDSVLYDFIKAAADLTVRIGVTMTSPHRPEFWPNTDIPYPLHDMGGMKTLRTGTGRVCHVVKHSEENPSLYWRYKPCPCSKCKASGKPSKVWWEMYVNTAAHVVFDDIELQHTTLRLFYDREDSPIVSLEDKEGVSFVDVREDRCRFTCVTCDGTLGNKLEIMVNCFKEALRIVTQNYGESRDLKKLSLIVSHPHGCCKQVSVGHWETTVWAILFENYTKFTYTTCTCPGSSGAYVHFVGFSTS